MFDMTEKDVIEFIKDFELDDEFETMLQYERIGLSEGIDIDKTNLSRECMICHYWYFKYVLNLSQILVASVVLNVSFQKQKDLKY